MSVVKIKDGNIAYAVEHAIELLGGIARHRQRKRSDSAEAEPGVSAASRHHQARSHRDLARLMKAAGKEVSIGEGSAAASPFNVHGMPRFSGPPSRTC